MESMNKLRLITHTCFTRNFIAIITLAVIGLCISVCGYCCECVNDPIVINSLVASPAVVRVGQTTTITADADDLDSVGMEPCTYQYDYSLFYEYSCDGVPATGENDEFHTHWNTPGLKTVTLNVYDDPATGIVDANPATSNVQVLVVQLDIATDSNNDGTIDAIDDYIEEVSPGRRIYTSDPNNNLAKVTLSHGPDALIGSYSITLMASSGGSNINVWTSADKTTQINLPATYSIANVPTEIYVEGSSSGETVLDMVLFDGVTELARDKVKFTISASSTTRVIRVKYHDDQQAHDGTTWNTAYNTIADALSNPQNGDEVWVASGTYNGCITLPAGVSLYGGFNGDESERPDWKTRLQNDPTILDGQSSGSVIIVASGATPSTVIDCLQIQNGNGRENYYGYHFGGGIYCGDANPTISHNTITGNNLAGDFGSGGGIYLSSSTENIHAIITGNKIYSNSTPTSGGCGGGICIQSKLPIIVNNLVYENSAQSGGGIYSSGDSIIVNNTVVSNTSSSQYASGSGVWCTFGYPTVANNIIYNNSIVGSMGTTLISNDVYSESISGGDYYPFMPHETDINVPPVFVNPDSDDYHLQETSPCIDAGDDDMPGLPSADIDGNARVLYDAVDIGADEYEDTISPTFTIVSITPCLVEVDDIVTIIFTVSEELIETPSVTVNGHQTTTPTNEGLTYTCQYTISSSDPPGDAIIQIAGVDTNDNEGSTIDDSTLVVAGQPEITSPISTTCELAPLIAWSVAGTYDRYQVQLVNVADQEDAWDSGEVLSASNSSLVTRLLTNNATYSVKVRVGRYCDWGEWSNSTEFTVAFTESPLPSSVPYCSQY